MEQPDVAAGLNEVRDSAEALLRQGERLALEGYGPQAAELLAEVWHIAKRCDQDLANLAAWDITWLLLVLQRQIGEIDGWVGRQCGKDVVPDSGVAPVAVARVDRVPGPELLGDLTPGSTGAHDPKHAGEKAPMVLGRTPGGRRRREDGRDALPPVVGQFGE